MPMTRTTTHRPRSSPRRSPWSSRLLAAAIGLALCGFGVGCDDKKNDKKKETAEASAPTPETTEPEPVAALPKGPPELSVDEVSPRVGFSRTVVMKPDGSPNPDGLAELRAKLEEAKEHIAEQDVVVRVHRQARPGWVTTYLNELGKLGPKSVAVETDTRPDYPSKVTALPETQLSNPAKCSLVGAILADRGTAIWRLSGGTARKRGRGMGGPDLTMTGETIESMAKGCAESSLFFASAAEGVEWGLVYDLAASALALEKAGLKTAVFPSQPTTAGHAVELAHGK